MGHNHWQPQGATDMLRDIEFCATAPSMTPQQHLGKLHDFHAHRVSRLGVRSGGTAAGPQSQNTQERPGHEDGRLRAGVSHTMMETPGDVAGVSAGQHTSACSGRTVQSKSASFATVLTTLKSRAAANHHTTATPVPQAKRRRAGRPLPGPETAGRAHVTHTNLNVLLSPLDAQAPCLHAARQKAILCDMLKEKLLMGTGPS